MTAPTTFSSQRQAITHQLSTPRLAVGAAINTSGLLSALVELTRGKDFQLRNDVRSITTRQRVFAGAMALPTSAVVVMHAVTLLERLNKAETEFGPSVSSDKKLKENVVSATMTAALCGFGLVTGKSLWPHRPLSKYGRLQMTASLASAVYLLIESGHELYRRSPELQERVAFAKLVAPIVAKQLLAKVKNRGQQPESDDINDLLADFFGSLPE